MATRQSQTDIARPPRRWSRSSTRICTRARRWRRSSRARSAAPGRNNNGHITMRHKGGGHKQHYRIVDFKRNKDGIAAKVERLEYDPNRSANIALAAVRGRRAPLHHRAARRRGRRAIDVGRRSADQAGQLRCRCATSRSARRSIASRCSRARARRWRARRAPACSCWRAKASTRSCGCARAKSARCMSTAARRSAKSATKNTACARSARQARSAGAASVRRCAASR